MQEILIIGAGLGGLTLANAIQKAKATLRVTILERDRDMASRPQGYGISLNRDGGLWALRQIGLYERIESVGRPTRLRFLTSSGKRLLDLPPQGPDSRFFTMAVPRSTLHNLLLQELGPAAVTWNSRCAGYGTENGRPFVLLEGGARYSADVVVACDGVHSVIRKQMLGDPPRFLGLTTIGGQLRQEVSHPVTQLGTFMTLGRGRFFFFSAFAKDVWQWSLTVRSSEKPFANWSGSELKERALREVGNWHDPIPDLVRMTADHDVGCRDLYDREPPRRVCDGQVVLLGDAAHPMSPFRGQGGNSAMVDAIKLATVLTGSEHGSPALESYAREMTARIRPLVRASFKSAQSLHATNPFVACLRNINLRFLDWMVNWKR